MIKFLLKCDANHQFDSWFHSADAFETLQSRGLITCAICGSTEVAKAIMAPAVRSARAPATDPTPTKAGTLAATDDGALKAQALAEMRKHVEANSDYVGLNFAREARDMHDGLTPERAIYGEAKTDEARKLVEDGVPVMPLPFVPARKTN